MLHIFVLLSLVGTIAGVYYPYPYYDYDFGGFFNGGGVVSKRDEGTDAAKPTSSQEVYDLIRDTLTRASQGINGSELGDAAVKIEGAARRFLVSNGLSATKQEVTDLIKDVATNLTVDTVLLGVFADPLSGEAGRLSAALQLLRDLSERAQQLEASGQNVAAAFSAIAHTARAIQKCILKVSDIITFVEAQANSHGVNTRDLAEHLLNKRVTLPGCIGLLPFPAFPLC